MKSQNIYNQIIITYFQIIKEAKQLISSLEDDALKATLERQDKPNILHGYIVHELINPLIYLRLEAYKDDLLGVHYGYEQSELYTKFYPITSSFIRSIYRFTAKENTSIDIENCVRTDWVITNCAELYEYMLDRNKHYPLSTLDCIEI